MKLLHLSQELYELGGRGTLFRAQWELRGRLRSLYDSDEFRAELGPYGGDAAELGWTRHLPLPDAPSVAACVPLPAAEKEKLARVADAATNGRILAFGRWYADFGSPVQWHLNPVTNRCWQAGRNLTSDIGEASPVGDVKFTWEIARFPHAYHMARAAAYVPEAAERWARALFHQMGDFNEANPSASGVHWTSGQEVAIRLLSWLFALDVFLSRTCLRDAATKLVAEALLTGATFVEEHLDYARLAVNNNHLLSEALLLLAAGALLPDAADAPRWRRVGYEILSEEAERQFYKDGGYIQHSHNYHRFVLQDLLWASAFAKSIGDRPSESWLGAMERSLDFLVAHQNPLDGRLPNYGSNDGSHPSPLSCCDFNDFRPTLQAVSLATRGERIYEPGPWDEEAAWFLGPKALDVPVREHRRLSVSFGTTGYHVLRGDDETSFATFRCGSLRDRFSQIDMLHLDVWWRGQNVLVDGGSYQYNGPREWHDHFIRTASHNTIELDSLDQMLHFRQFKVLYWTKASLLRFEDRSRWCLVEGEHYGYRRHPGKCVHRRSVLFVKDDVWVVVDQVSGLGAHTARLHWLGGEFPWAADEARGLLTLATPQGDFTIRVLDENGNSIQSDAVAGQDSPARGWLSRYYGEKTAVPSLMSTRRGSMPLTFLSVLAGTSYELTPTAGGLKLITNAVTATLGIDDGQFTRIDVT